jgi:MFS family permease
MTVEHPAPQPGLSTMRVLGIAAAAGLVPLNSTMIAVALPKIAEDFDISTGTASLLVTAYLVAMLVGQPLAGRLGDAFGNRRAVNVALIGLILASLGAAASETFLLLTVARVVQAGFAAALVPGVQAILRAGTPSRNQGRTFGLLGSVLGAGAASGPVIGGILTQAFGWQATFLINVPVAASALVLLARVHRNVTEPSEPAEAVAPADHGRIANSTFISAFSVQALSTLAQYALLLLTPIILNARGWESGPIGLVLSALTVGMIIMGPPGGRMGDIRGRRAPLRSGLTVATVALVLLLVGGPSIATPVLIAGLALFGFGLGTATPNLTAAALASVPMGRTGTAAGVFSTSRYFGSITTSVAISIFVASDAGGSRIVLALGVAAMAMAIAIAGGIPAEPNKESDTGRARRHRGRRVSAHTSGDSNSLAAYGPVGPEAESHLEVLGLGTRATWAEIKAAHAGILSQHLPADHEDEDNKDQIASADAIRREMNLAYASLRLLAVV